MLSSLVEQVPLALAIFDTEMRFLAASPSYLSSMAQLTSGETFAPTDVIGRSIYETFPKIPALWREIYYSRALAGEKRAEQEMSVRRDDGGIDFVRWSVSPWRTADGRIGGVLVFGEIVTDEVQAKRALAESEVRFRATFENAAVGISHVAPDGKFLRSNRAVHRILGFPAGELHTKSIWELTHPDDLAFELAQLEQLKDGRIGSYSMDKRVVRKDGTTGWVRLTRSCVRKSDGSVDYFVAVLEDISARKRAEEELRRSEEQFRSCLVQSPMPVLLYDDREQILAVSQKLLEMTGYTREELHRMEDWTIRAYGERAGEMREVIREIIATEPEALPSEHVILTRGGDKRIWDFVTSALGPQSDGRRLFVALAQDTTTRRAYEERIQLLMREARHRTKNILSLVQVIARQTAASDSHDFFSRFTDRIRALAANQDLLVRHEWRRIDVKDLVQAQLGHFADLIGTRIRLDGPKLRLNATAAQAIGLALHELATNASKYGALSTDAGRVDVSWQIDDDTFVASWIERNGPPVRLPERRGFGSTVIESMVKQTLGAEVQLDYAPSGLEWRLTCQKRAVEGEADSHRLPST